jgi:hypothetical protein
MGTRAAVAPEYGRKRRLAANVQLKGEYEM